MEHLKINNMQQPQSVWWQTVLDWIGQNTVLFGVLGLIWKAIDKGFEHLEKTRNERLINLIETHLKTTVTPEIKKLSESIDDLKNAIWEMKKP
jgi:hypothetical protein